MDEHIQRILWTEKEIADRVAELGSDISKDFQGYSPPLVIIGVYNGPSVNFLLLLCWCSYFMGVMPSLDTRTPWKELLVLYLPRLCETKLQ